VNNVVIKKTTVVQVQRINIYRNAGVHNALVAVDENHFGRGRISSARIAGVNTKNFRPIHTAPRFNATYTSFEPDTRRGIRPPDRNQKRSIVATRPPHAAAGQVPAIKPNIPKAGTSGPPHLVGAPKRRESGPSLPRPSFGQSKVERPMGDRVQQPVPPRLNEEPRRAARLSNTGPTLARTLPLQPRNALQATSPSTKVARSPVGRSEGLYPQKRRYPGEPANNISPYEFNRDRARR
jgi:hypothetical protein